MVCMSVWFRIGLSSCSTVYLDKPMRNHTLMQTIAVCPRDGLHERVVPHRLVEIHGGAARRVEASQPHCADEYQAQRVLSVLEPLVKRRLRLVHPPAMGLDV